MEDRRTQLNTIGDFDRRGGSGAAIAGVAFRYWLTHDISPLDHDHVNAQLQDRKYHSLLRLGSNAIQRESARSTSRGVPRSVGAAAAEVDTKGQNLYDSLPDEVKYRVLTRDAKGRPFGSPANPRLPTAEELNASLVNVPASEIRGVYAETKHGLFPEQLSAVRKLSNEELLKFHATDPISVGHTPKGGLLTGGHHRMAVIQERLQSGQLSPDDIVKVLFHD